MYRTLARKFIGISDGQIDEEIETLRVGKEYTLIHPLSAPAETLERLLPTNINIDEILRKIPEKQKEIAHRIDISKLPSDRPPGFIGQAALFEVMREMNCDFSFSLSNDDLTEEFLFFQVLAKSQFSVDFLGYEKDHFSVDLYFEPWDRGRRSDRRTKIWTDRILSVYFFRIQQNLDFYRKPELRTIIKQTLKIQDKRGSTTSRVQNWLNCSISKAKKINKIFNSFSLVHRINTLNLPRAGLVRTVQESKIVPKPTNLEFWFHGTKMKDNSPTFLVGKIDRKSQGEDRTLELEAVRLNSEMYDDRLSRWSFPQDFSDIQSVNTLHQLFDYSNLNAIDTEIAISERDLFYLGISRMSYYNRLTYDEISRYLDVQVSDVQDAFRNLFRKKLIRNIFKPCASGLSEFIVIGVDDNPNCIIPFLGSVVQVAPTSTLRVSRDFNHACMWHNLPKYLVNEFTTKVNQIGRECNVDPDIFKITTFKPFHLSSIMSLLGH
ncbi:hypothetical protein EU528_12985 [Candidatus Thorarchaeota archaeon]|nr:MAG: hypothetical protein EU528_12985 [Candidatus Thorarchaeota archaeon]